MTDAELAVQQHEQKYHGLDKPEHVELWKWREFKLWWEDGNLYASNQEGFTRMWFCSVTGIAVTTVPGFVPAFAVAYGRANAKGLIKDPKFEWLKGEPECPHADEDAVWLGQFACPRAALGAKLDLFWLDSARLPSCSCCQSETITRARSLGLAVNEPKQEPKPTDLEVAYATLDKTIDLWRRKVAAGGDTPGPEFCPLCTMYGYCSTASSCPYKTIGYGCREGSIWDAWHNNHCIQTAQAVLDSLLDTRARLIGGTRGNWQFKPKSESKPEPKHETFVRIFRLDPAKPGMGYSVGGFGTLFLSSYRTVEYPLDGSWIDVPGFGAFVCQEDKPLVFAGGCPSDPSHVGLFRVECEKVKTLAFVQGIHVTAQRIRVIERLPWTWLRGKDFGQDWLGNNAPSILRLIEGETAWMPKVGDMIVDTGAQYRHGEPMEFVGYVAGVSVSFPWKTRYANGKIGGFLSLDRLRPATPEEAARFRLGAHPFKAGDWARSLGSDVARLVFDVRTTYRHEINLDYSWFPASDYEKVRVGPA